MANKRIKKPVIVIICEGEKTEVIYFNDLKQLIGRQSPITIKTIRKTGVTPSRLVSYAKKMASDLDIDPGRGDQVWCVFDVDDRDDKEIHKTRCLAQAKINLAISNPCFELWYLLHFEGSSGHLDQTQARRKLEKYIPGYQKNRSVMADIQALLTNAIENAKFLRKYHKNNKTNVFSREGNPCTFVDQLVEQLPIS